MSAPTSIFSAHIELYEEFDGDPDMYQRRGMPKKAVLPDIWEAWGAIEDLRRRLYLAAAGLASAKFSASAEADLLEWVPDEDTRLRIRAIVERDIQLKGGAAV